METERIRELSKALEAEGRSGFCPTATVSRGEAIGKALFSALDVADCVALAIEVLEQWNSHLSVAAIGAIENGLGKVKRNGRQLHIQLPEHWEKL
jgi:hypothetical protein